MALLLEMAFNAGKSPRYWPKWLRGFNDDSHMLATIVAFYNDNTSTRAILPRPIKSHATIVV